jgi:hypothetical protein
MFETKIDMVGPNGGQGPLAQNLTGSGGLNIGAMRPYIGKNGSTKVTVYQGGNPKKASSWKTLQVNDKGTLRRDEWKALDEALIGVAESRLTGTQHLINSGLTYQLGNAMGTTVLEYHNVGDALVAELSMDAVTRTKGDRQEFDSVYLPIPIIHVDYSINQRALAASRSLGNPLDTSMAERAGRRVMEKQEEMLFTNTDYSYGSGTIYSFLNHPNRITSADILDWSGAAVTGADIVTDVLEMKQASIDAKFYGPWTLFVPTNFETKLDEDYADAKGDNTIRDRVLAINGIQEIIVVDTLPNSNVVLVQKSSDVIRIVQGLALQNIQWQTEGGFVNKFKVISIQVPQIRADQDGNTGLVHSTVAST